ncbi:MAG: hypothetical protein IPM51_16355 [Sphingobacteriaceae bacterium]|nr:hypothetical protein [Sphingobacteriaceae bacterium]
MDHVSFFPFHNRHIRFLYDGQEMQGVVVDSIPYNEKAFSTQYVYIATRNMRAWKDAEKIQDNRAMRALEKKIDLLKITNPSLINH